MPNHPDPHVTEAMQAPQGLSSADAALRLAHDGANELYVPPRNTLTHALFALLREPLFVLLFSAAGLYLLLGDRVEALALMASVGVAAAITIFQSYRTERVLLALRDLSSPRAAVVRDGVLLRIAGRELVAGDLMVIGEGDRIATDAARASTPHGAMSAPCPPWRFHGKALLPGSGRIGRRFLLVRA